MQACACLRLHVSEVHVEHQNSDNFARNTPEFQICPPASLMSCACRVKLRHTAAPINIPIGLESALKGIVDVVERKVRTRPCVSEFRIIFKPCALYVHSRWLR